MPAAMVRKLSLMCSLYIASLVSSGPPHALHCTVILPKSKSLPAVPRPAPPPPPPLLLLMLLLWVLAGVAGDEDRRLAPASGVDAVDPVAAAAAAAAGFPAVDDEDEDDKDLFSEGSRGVDDVEPPSGWCDGAPEGA